MKRKGDEERVRAAANGRTGDGVFDAEPGATAAAGGGVRRERTRIACMRLFLPPASVTEL